MALVEIGGTTHLVYRDSLNMTERVGERSSASCRIHDRDSAYSFQRGQSVVIYDDDGVKIFGGVVSGKPTMKRVSPASGLMHKLRFSDWHYLADKRNAARSYTDKTTGYMVSDLVTEYLAAEGVTEGDVQAGPTIPNLSIKYIKVSEALDKIAELAGFIWYIDKDKQLFFIDRTTYAAPWVVDPSIASNLILRGSTSLGQGSEKYRNTQIIRGTTAETNIPVDEPEVQLGDGEKMAFAVRYAVSQVPTIRIDTGGGWTAQTVGIKGIDTGKDWYWSKGDKIIAQEEGDTPLGNTDKIEIAYVGMYEVVIKAQDDDLIADQLAIEGAGTGINEAVEDRPDVDDQDTGIDVALALIAEYGANAKLYKFKTRRTGLQAGMLVPVNDSRYGLSNEEMLIESVSYSRNAGKYEFSVTAVMGPVSGSWERFFRKLAEIGQTNVTDVDIGTGTLIILKQLSQIWELTNSITFTTYSCDVPANDLYPSNTRYPC